MKATKKTRPNGLTVVRKQKPANHKLPKPAKTGDGITPKNQFRIEGDIVHILLTDGGGKETTINLHNWPEVQKYEWHYVREGKMEYAATFLEHESGSKILLYLHDLIVALNPERFGDLYLVLDDGVALIKRSLSDGDATIAIPKLTLRRLEPEPLWSNN
jgi:hypothetical protein